MAIVMLAAVAVPTSRARAQPAAPAADQEARVERALDHYDSDNFEGCIADLTEVLAANPQHATARFLRALAYGRLGRTHELTGEDRLAAEQYQLMKADLDVLLSDTLRSEYAIAELISGIVRAKLAGYAEGDYEQRIRARAELLAEAQHAFERYLDPPPQNGLPAPTGLNRVRARFFLGVVLYRQALRPAKGEEDADELDDPAKLAEAERIMSSLLDPASPDSVEQLLSPEMPERQQEVQRWKSYAAVYMGLIRTRQAVEAGAEHRRYSRARKLYDDAQREFVRAKELDWYENRSLSYEFIPGLVDKQQQEIERAESNLPEPTHDFLIQWKTGLAYDTNVILLGGNTIPPRGITDKDDFRFTTGVGLGYTLDLGAIDPSLDRWSLGLLGRASGNWNADIHEYNEQNYGGSAALQYELKHTWKSDGMRHGPLYAGIQYDYDYFLLGNNGFLRTNRVTPRLTLLSFDEKAGTVLGFRYEDRNYLERLRDLRFDRDGNYFGFNLTQWLDWVDMTKWYNSMKLEPWGRPGDPVDPQREGYPADATEDARGYQRFLRPYIGVEYGWDSTVGKEFDEKRYGLFCGVDLPLPYGLLFNFIGEWEWQDYYHNGSLVDFHRRGRNDFIQSYSFGLERRFVLAPGRRVNRYRLAMDRVVMTLRGDIRFTDDDSNVKDRVGENIFSYDRTIYGMSVSFEFN